MKKIVKNFLEKENLLNKDATFVVAFSGGFDSMALADALILLSEKYNFKVVLAHLNHNWRGEKSKQEALNCENFAKEKGVEFYTETLPDNLPHSETVAREERYKFFKRACKKYATDKLLTAHTKSDNVETILQRIIKGTGVSGLCGIPLVRGFEGIAIYRPMLEISREEVLNYCKANKLKPNNDNSNEDNSYLRNRIRNLLLPELENNYDKNARNALIRLIQNANETEEIVEEYLTEKLKNVIDDKEIRTQKFLKLSIPIKKRVVKNLLEENNFDYDMKRISEVLDFIENSSVSKSGKTFSLSETSWLFINDKIIKIIDENSINKHYIEYELNMNGETYIKEFNAIIKVSEWVGDKPMSFPAENDNCIYADLSKIELPLKVRTRLDGDRIIPFGKHSPIKLKKFLNNKKIARHDKSKVLLITSAKEVLWAINLGISNSIKVCDMPTHKVEIIYKELRWTI